MLLKTSLTALVMVLPMSLGSAQAADPSGTWLTGEGDAGVEIAPCVAPAAVAAPARGAAPPPPPSAARPAAPATAKPTGPLTEVCGTIVWLKEPIDPATRRPPVDQKNSDPALRQRPILGLPMMRMKIDPKGNWAGSIYNSDDGSTYNATLTMEAPTKVTIRGCWGPFCGSDSWTKMAAVPGAVPATPGTQGGNPAGAPGAATAARPPQASPRSATQPAAQAPATQGAAAATQGSSIGLRP